MIKHVKRAGSIMIVSFSLSQILRLSGNLITARLLNPEMYGVMAVVIVLQMGIAMLSDVGLGSYVMRNQDYKNKSMLNTVWTIQVIRGICLSFFMVVLGCLLFVFQPYIERNGWGVISNNELPGLIIFSALNPLLMGFKSMSYFVNSREFKRFRIELSELLCQIISLVVVVAWAYFYPSVWALAAASVFHSLFNTILSYLIFDIRHRVVWCKEIASEVYRFGKWIFLASAMTFLSQQADRIYLSVNITEVQLGLYSIAMVLTGFVTSLIQKFTSQVWLPAFSNQLMSSQNLAKLYYKIRLVQDSSVGMIVLLAALFSTDVIKMIYDPRYIDVGWLLKATIITAIPLSIRATLQALLVAEGETKVQMQVMLVNTFSLIVTMPVLFGLYGILGAIYSVILSTTISMLPQYFKLKQKKILAIKMELRTIPLFVLVSLVALWGIE